MQLPLGISLDYSATFSSFVNKNNEQAVTYLKDFTLNNENFVYLWGNKGSGKTHLLQACCNSLLDNNKSAIYIPLKNVAEIDKLNYALKNLEYIDLICLDDLDCCTNQLEEPVFHLYNKTKDRNKKIIISSSKSIEELDLSLADLKSRLTWGLRFHLDLLDDYSMLSAIKLRALDKGLSLGDLEAKFLLNRCPRNMAELYIALDTLDLASLANKRRITIPFIKQVLGL